MIFQETDIDGSYLIELERFSDERGFFARTWCSEEFKARGLPSSFLQANTAFSRMRGTLRGLHYQEAPHEEGKLVRCIKGAVYDVVVDLRKGSPTYKTWIGVELSDENRQQLYVPEGCAHGYQTLSDDAEVFYLVTAPYAPQAERGIRYNDPAFGIDWPLAIQVISEKDQTWSYFEQEPEVDQADGPLEQTG